jgi:putative nucleotidyltransferase with HDIG domain
MRFLKRRAEAVSEPVQPNGNSGRKPPLLEGWTEAEIVSVYNAARVKHFESGDLVLQDAESTDSFLLVLDGSIQLVVNWNVHRGNPGVVRRGECLEPLPKVAGVRYAAKALEPLTVIEITPAVLNLLSASAQVRIYKAAIATSSRINGHVRTVNGEVTAKNILLASYITSCEARRHMSTDWEPVKNFIKNIPALPNHAMDLAVKLVQDSTSVQEIVEAIKRDPPTASLILRTVNSALYSFSKKIETFYHACMILGFNNIYTLIMREAVQSAIPLTAETRRIHTHSALISTLCYEIARVSKDAPAQTATTAGLLHDVGKCIQIMMKQSRWVLDGYVDTLDPARLGAELLRAWGLPERLCQIIERQDLPDYTPPELVASEYRRELGILHLAHHLETLLSGKPLTPESTIYTQDYMAFLGIASASPQALLKETVLPGLAKNLPRLPQEIQKMISAARSAGIAQS